MKAATENILESTFLVTKEDQLEKEDLLARKAPKDPAEIEDLLARKALQDLGERRDITDASDIRAPEVVKDRKDLEVVRDLRDPEVPEAAKDLKDITEIVESSVKKENAESTVNLEKKDAEAFQDVMEKLDTQAR